MDKNYNYLGGYDYGYNEDNALIPKSQGVDKEEVNKAINNLVGNAPEEFDTIEELAQAVQELGGAELTEIKEELNKKADKSELEGLATTEDINEVKASVEKIIDGAPESLDQLKEIIEVLEEKQDATQVLEAISTKAEQSEVDALTSALADKADKSELPNMEDYAKKSDIPEIPTKVSAFENDANYLTEHQDLSDYAKKSDIPEIPTKVSAFENDANYLTEHQDLSDYAKKNDIPEIPTKVSAFENDANYLTEHQDLSDYAKKNDIPEIPTKVSAFENDANYLTEHQDLSNYAKKSDIPEIPTKVSAFENDANYLTEHQDLSNYAKKSDIPEIPTKVSAFENDANYLTEHQDLSNYAKKSDIPELPTLATVATTGDYNDLINKPESMVDTRVSGVDVVVDEDEGKLLVITSTDGTNESEVSVKTTKIFDHSQYYTKDETSATFIDNNEANTLINAAIAPKADTSALLSAVHELVVRLDKLEAQNAYLVENNTTSGDEINNMTTEEALNAEITVCSPEAVNALKTNKEFKSVNLIGAEVGNDDMIYTTATDDVNVNGVTVSGEKGSKHGKINFATSNINISNVNIEPGCTVYNVFEGSQDKDAGHSIDTFIATNVVVNDTDLKHNVFNIYQFNNDAEVLIKDCSFNLDVVNSNILRISNITNARNVTITFENVDWTYENKAYTDADKAWAGLMIYQPYGSDAAFSGDTSNMQTWTLHFKNCRYNGELVTQNNFGLINQLAYQYNVNNNGICQAPAVFGDNIIIE